MVPSPRHGWGLPHGGQLRHAFPSALSTGSTSRLTAQFFAFWPTAPSLAGTHCQSATSPVGLRRGLDFNQLEAGITPRHPPLLFKEGKDLLQRVHRQSRKNLRIEIRRFLRHDISLEGNVTHLIQTSGIQKKSDLGLAFPN